MLANIISSIIYYLIKIVGSTYRFRYSQIKQRAEGIKQSKSNNYVYSIWHQSIIGALYGHLKIPHVVIVSRSKDGDIVAYTTKKLGHVAARGSSSRGGLMARAEMIEYLEKGVHGAITVDAPRGPAKVPKKGIIDIASRTGCAIIPLIVLSEKYWCFKKSWDKFQIPRPFSRNIIHFGQPIQVPPDLKREDLDQYLKNLQKIMIEEEKSIQDQFNNWDQLSKTITS